LFHGKVCKKRSQIIIIFTRATLIIGSSVFGGISRMYLLLFAILGSDTQFSEKKLNFFFSFFVLCVIEVWSFRRHLPQRNSRFFWHYFARAGSSIERVSFGSLIRIRWTGGLLSSLTLAPLTLPTPLQSPLPLFLASPLLHPPYHTKL
jgi:hypothetical protein